MDPRLTKILVVSDQEKQHKLWVMGQDTRAPICLRDTSWRTGQQVQNFIDGLNLEPDWTEVLPLCYKGIVSQDLIDFPAVTFHFAGGADLVLGTNNLFLSHIPAYGSFCLAVTMVNGNNTAPEGGGVNVGYDLLARKLSFMTLNCGFLYS
ncbi:hypothetical protein RJ640_004961 [Escallonia rubra]|uniref:Uncharacterized protein n=1 Tax=Escallonia rubra TaxID=112253 RepID=A0AA88U7U7_9ASTE|nr:hypothetical protein RJ640_004961 [Escallonia rubra]